MILYKEVHEVVKKIDKTMCNCCGKEIKNTKESLINIAFTFNYFTKLFIDGERHRIDICENCYAKWIKTFKHAPEGFGRSILEKDGINFEEWKCL